ncbi:hypothetical protein HPB51_029809 [Rhipicephalus microplus]|uniref:Uncharacterized protein n=1 Tax=Rhipicephalus microplus TaxID=6941 RepID=A0A9J6CTV2_RHIMP|nr:hypothetical protein HPB51_029809 [Rhipicephalus microplus]
MNAGAVAACLIDRVKWDFQAFICAPWPLAVLAFHQYVIESPSIFIARGGRQAANIAASRLYGIDLPPELRVQKEDSAAHRVHWLNMSRWNLSFFQLFQLRALQIIGNLMEESKANPAPSLLLAGQTGVAAYLLRGRKWSVVTGSWAHRRFSSPRPISRYNHWRTCHLVGMVLFLFGPKWLLNKIGFGRKGVIADSLAAGFQVFTSWKSKFAQKYAPLADSDECFGGQPLRRRWIRTVKIQNATVKEIAREREKNVEEALSD